MLAKQSETYDVEPTKEFVETQVVDTIPFQPQDTPKNPALATDINIKEAREQNTSHQEEAAIYEERLATFKKILKEHHQNRNQLEERASLYGLNIPIEIVNQIKYFSEQIEQVEEEIEKVKQQITDLIS
jgi:hypothetical protein